MNMENAIWFAACDGLLSMGPYKTQREAWQSLTLTGEEQKRQGRKIARGGYVWPKWPDKESK